MITVQATVTLKSLEGKPISDRAVRSVLKEYDLEVLYMKDIEFARLYRICYTCNAKNVTDAFEKLRLKKTRIEKEKGIFAMFELTYGVNEDMEYTKRKRTPPGELKSFEINGTRFECPPFGEPKSTYWTNVEDINKLLNEACHSYDSIVTNVLKLPTTLRNKYFEHVKNGSTPERVVKLCQAKFPLSEETKLKLPETKTKDRIWVNVKGEPKPVVQPTEFYKDLQGKQIKLVVSNDNVYELLINNVLICNLSNCLELNSDGNFPKIVIEKPNKYWFVAIGSISTLKDDLNSAIQEAIKYYNKKRENDK